MTRAALILFDDDDPAVSVLGVSWPEFRVRGAVRAGAMHVVVVAGRITPQIIAAIDWAKAVGVSVVLARTAIEIADLVHPDESVLLLTGSAIVDDYRLASLMEAERPTLLCLPADAEPVWELIDARARWTGLARLDGAQIRATAAMVGDWDLGSTLLRQAVATAQRRMLDDDEPLWRAEREHDVIEASRAIVAVSVESRGGWASRSIVTPLVRLAGNLLGDRLATIARFSPVIAALPLMAGVSFAWLGWPAAAAALLVLAFAGDALGMLAECATALEPRFSVWRRRALDGGSIAALAGLVLPSAVDHAPLVLAIMLVVMAALAARLGRSDAEPVWLADVPGHAIIIGVASIFGHTGLVVGLAIALTHAVASLAWRQNRLSRALTQAG